MLCDPIFQTEVRRIKVVMYRVSVFDLVHHTLSHMFHLLTICGIHLISLCLAHLSLGVVEKVFVQLSICQSYDNTGGAITCRHKETGHPSCNFTLLSYPPLQISMHALL